VAKAATLALSASDRDALFNGARDLGVELDEAARAALDAFVELLALWSPKVNLISCADGRELVERHLLDALVAAPLLGSGGRLVDLGSGAGFPGVPLAIARPDAAVVLVEPRRRRASFLREVRRNVPLANVSVLEQRAEDAGSVTADVVTCRAVWPVATVVHFARSWVRPGGTLALFCSVTDARAVDAADFEVVDIREYRIESGRLRALVILQSPADR
jgi:16S rRNA (guanine527-N7)-methyltransferase